MKISLRNAGQSVKIPITCKIRASVTSDKTLSLCIVFGAQATVPLATTTTSPMLMVNYYLSIEAQDWEDVWYKDEGGRDKCMLAEVSLRRVDDSPVYNLRVPLRMTLRYDDPISLTVQNQDILRVLGPPRQFIDGDTGKALVRFRVEDVSKNHQGQDFKLEVSADTSKFGDVAPVCTPSVSVRSKRNKRQRSSIQTSDQQSTASATETDFAPSRPGAPFTSRQLSASRDPPQSSGTFRHTSPSASQRGSGSLTGVSDLTKLRDAMQGVIRWTDEVVNGLYPLQWQVIGYAPFPDGTIDYNHPYHSMPNPNPCISRVLSMYSSQTREDLRTLMNAVEQTLATNPMSGVGGRDDRIPHSALRPSTEDSRVVLQTQLQDTHSRSAGRSGFRDHLTDSFAISRQQSLTQHIHTSGSLPSISGLNTQLYKTDSRQSEFDQSLEEVQSQVAYVLAKQYKSLLTGERLGFPAFNIAREILGFYQESNTKVGMERFVPINRLAAEFGPVERDQASHILTECIESKSDAVYFIKDFDSVTSLVDHALVYEWSKSYSTSGPSRLEPPSFS